jgi:hypothetical protein
MNTRRFLTRLRSPWQRRSGEDGQALVLFAGALTVMLLASGLVVDGGVAFYNRREAQNEADLAALAGTHVIAKHYTDGGRSGSQVYDALVESMTANGCDDDDDASVPCTWSATYVRPATGGGEVNLSNVTNGGSIPAGAQGVAVRVDREPDTYFLNLIGQQSWDVHTEAAGMTARAGGLPPGQVLPIAVDPPNNNFQRNGVYELTAGKDAPGNFSWLSWDGSNSAGSLAESLCNPNNPALSFPVWVDGDPGKSNSSSVRACVDKWIDNEVTVLLPMWSCTAAMLAQDPFCKGVRGNGNNTEYNIVGLGAFVLLDRGQPAIDSIRGRFVEYYPLPTIGPNATWGLPPCAPGSPDCYDQTVFVGLSR